MKQDALYSYTANALLDAELSVKLNEMLWYVVDEFNTSLSDTKFKYTNLEELGEEAIKQKIVEIGYEYIKDVMDTITDFQFNQLLLFIDLVSQLKGTRRGIELVLQLLGFTSDILEWWEVSPQKPPWTYEIIVYMDLSVVHDPYNTLNKIRIFSRFYQIANISNIDLLFTVSQFAESAPIMAGFHSYRHFGSIVQRV